MLKIGLSVLSILLISVSYFAFANAPAVQHIPDWDFPQLDELVMIEKYPWDVALESALACDIDTYWGAIRTGEVDELRAAGWNYSSAAGFHMCYIGFNCRDEALETSGAYYDYHGRTAATFPSYYPLNISSFRLALQYIVGCEKDAWIAEIYGYINVRLDQCIPPANAYWFNPYITPYPEDWAMAYDTLIEAGFSGTIGGDDWIMPNGERLRDRWAGDGYCIYVLCPGDALAPTSHEITRRHTIKWNEFFTGVATDNCGDPMNPDDGGIFQDEPDDIYLPLIAAPFYNRDHDIYMLCWGLGRDPDYLEDLFAPWYDVPGAANSPGLDNYDLNLLLRTISFWTMADYEICWMNLGDPPQPKVIDACETCDHSTENLKKVVFQELDKTGLQKDLLIDEEYEFTPVGDVDLEDPVCSQWHEQWPHPELDREYHLIKWFDWNGDMILSPCDSVVLEIKEGYVQNDYHPTYGYEQIKRIHGHVNSIDGGLYLILEPSYEIDVTGRVHLLEPMLLNPGEAIEILYEPGTYTRIIFERDEMRDIVWLTQWKLWYLAPYCPIYSRNYFNLFKPGLTGWVESPGYGSHNSWTYANLDWEDPPPPDRVRANGDVFANIHVSGDVPTLNPITAHWVYEWQIISRMYDGLIEVDPYTHDDMPWIALKWEMIPWESEDPYVPNGMIVKFWIRDDVYWQDDNHVTAADIKWNFDFIKSIEAPEYITVWLYYIKSEVVNDQVIKIYLNATGAPQMYTMAGNALVFPKIVWEPFWGDYTGASEWDPWNEDYEAWTGCPAPIDKPGLTCLFGTGPFWLKDWNEIDTATLLKNREYWVRLATKCQQCNQLPGLTTCSQATKELTVHMDVELYPYEVVDIIDPICTDWHELCPDKSNNYHCTSWEDNGDGYLSPSDQIDLTDHQGTVHWYHVDALTVNMWLIDMEPGLKQKYAVKFNGTLEEFKYEFKYVPECTQWLEVYPFYNPTACWQIQREWHLVEWIDTGEPYGELSPCDEIMMQDKDTGELRTFHVEALTTDMWITPKDYKNVAVPKITKPFLDVVVVNPDAFRPCTFTYRVLMDKTEEVESGGPITLLPYESIHIVSEIPDDLPACVHEWVLEITQIEPYPGAVNVYKKIMAYTIGDANGDCVTNMKDIYAMIRAFGATPADPDWSRECDINNDDVVNMKDIYSGIRHFGQSCQC